jgi:hypothetical protein
MKSVGSRHYSHKVMIVVAPSFIHSFVLVVSVSPLHTFKVFFGT